MKNTMKALLKKFSLPTMIVGTLLTFATLSAPRDLAAQRGGDGRNFSGRSGRSFSGGRSSSGSRNFSRGRTFVAPRRDFNRGGGSRFFFGFSSPGYSYAPYSYRSYAPYVPPSCGFYDAWGYWVPQPCYVYPYGY